MREPQRQLGYRQWRGKVKLPACYIITLPSQNTLTQKYITKNSYLDFSNSIMSSSSPWDKPCRLIQNLPCHCWKTQKLVRIVQTSLLSSFSIPSLPLSSSGPLFLAAELHSRHNLGSWRHDPFCSWINPKLLGSLQELLAFSRLLVERILLREWRPERWTSDRERRQEHDAHWASFILSSLCSSQSHNRCSKVYSNLISRIWSKQKMWYRRSDIFSYLYIQEWRNTTTEVKAHQLTKWEYLRLKLKKETSRSRLKNTWRRYEDFCKDDT